MPADPPTTDLGDQLRRLAAWCDRNRVAQADALTAECWAGRMGVHLRPEAFHRMADAGGYETRPDPNGGFDYLFVVLDGVHAYTLERKPVAAGAEP